jgi:hypothetical protein
MINHLIPLARLIITREREVNVAHTRDVSKCSLRPKKKAPTDHSSDGLINYNSDFFLLLSIRCLAFVGVVGGVNGQAQVSATIMASRVDWARVVYFTV